MLQFSQFYCFTGYKYYICYFDYPAYILIWLFITLKYDINEFFNTSSLANKLLISN